MNRYAVKNLRILLLFLGLLTVLSTITPAQDEKKPGPDLRTVISQIARDNLPAVVHIQVTRIQEAPLLGLDDPFWQPLFPGFPVSDRKSLVMGSGLIMDEQGHVLTNQHLVINAQQIRIILSNNQRYNARLLGLDNRTDLAVLQIQASGPFPHVRFGNSDQLELGEWVIALGHSPEAEQTVTKGIICGRHRKGIVVPAGYKDFIQTDTIINNGNCGGPLLNLKGEVIGINILPPRTTRPEGFSLAIPANLALDLTKRLISSGKLERAWLGAGIQDLSAEQARALGLEPSIRGALIMDLVKNGPAEQGGLKKGDVVISFLDKEIRTAPDLQDQVANSPLGQEVKAVVFRKGSKVSLKIKLGKQEESIAQSQAALKYRLGAEVRSLTGPELTQLGLTAPQGVLVVWVDPSGPLYEIGLEQGDIIFQINGRTIRDEKGLTELVQILDPGQWITLLALDHRSGRHGYIQVSVR